MSNKSSSNKPPKDTVTHRAEISGVSRIREAALIAAARVQERIKGKRLVKIDKKTWVYQ